MDNEFELDPRLKNDCFILLDSLTCQVLLMNNKDFPWFIIVPKTDKTEIFELGEDLQADVMKVINQLSQFMNVEFNPDKMNIACIGNIVKQLHIHVIARFKTDRCWPGVVWGSPAETKYTQKAVNNLKIKLNNILVI